MRLIWKHSIAVAVCARLLATELKLQDADTFFTVGILHDVGLLVEYLAFKDIFDDIEDAIIHHDDQITDVEHTVFDFDHVEVSCLFVDNWKLPTSITEKIRYHHNPLIAGDDTKLSAGIMRLADVVSLRADSGITNGELTSLEKEVLTTTNIDEGVFQSILPLYINEYNNALIYFD